jgi:hypothetical protein
MSFMSLVPVPPYRLLGAALRRVGIPARAVTHDRIRFPQPRRYSSTVGRTVAVSQSLTALQIPVARALPGAEDRVEVGRTIETPQGKFSCVVDRNRLVVFVDPGQKGTTVALTCQPPKKSLKTGARAYEELGGGTPWHDGLDDNGTYYWTVDLLKSRGRAAKVVPMGLYKDAAKDFGEHPLRARLRKLIEPTRLLDQAGLTVDWNLLPVETGRSPVVAGLFLPISTPDLPEVLAPASAALAKARSRLDRSPEFIGIWKYVSGDRVLLF